MEDGYQKNTETSDESISQRAHVPKELTHQRRPPSGCPARPSAPHQSDRRRAVLVNDSGTRCSLRCTCTQRGDLTCHIMIFRIRTDFLIYSWIHFYFITLGKHFFLFYRSSIFFFIKLLGAGFNCDYSIFLTECSFCCSLNLTKQVKKDMRSVGSWDIKIWRDSGRNV